MRIIGGQARGRLIRLPARATLRPTTDRIRKSLFDILPLLPGLFFLDLFAGGGSVGLEAISRGAEKVFFVERDVLLAEAIRNNLRVLGSEAQAELIVADARKALDRFAKQEICFDVLFADPPYDRGHVSQVCTWLSGGKLLAEKGVAVIQHSVRELLACPTGALFVTDQRRYGDTLLTFLNKKKV